MAINVPIQSLPGEEWAPVTGYEEQYFISNMGRMLSMPNCIHSTPVLVKPIIQHSGYAHVGLNRNGSCKQSRLHRLVAEAFCPNSDPNNKTQINHINENKLDNRACNLEWVTAKENTNHGTAIARRLYGRQKAVECLDSHGAVLRVFISQAEANAWCGVARNDGHIAACCKGKQKTAYGFRWRYAAKGGDVSCCRQAETCG